MTTCSGVLSGMAMGYCCLWTNATGSHGEDVVKARRVVLLSNRSLLAAAVQTLLLGLDGVELHTVSVDDPKALFTLQSLAPHVIILDSGDASLGEGIITRMLKEHSRTRVIAVNLDQTGIEVYRVRRTVETDLDGLLEAIRGKWFPEKEARRKATNTTGSGDGGETMGT